MSEIKVLRSQVKKYIDKASDKELELVYHLFEATDKSDWWDDIIQSQKDAIDTGIKQINNGEGVPHKDVMKKYNTWLKK